jgi:hypothetical protein
MIDSATNIVDGDIFLRDHDFGIEKSIKDKRNMQLNLHLLLFPSRTTAVHGKNPSRDHPSTSKIY